MGGITVEADARNISQILFIFESKMKQINLPKICQADEEERSSHGPYQELIVTPAIASLAHGYCH